MLGCFKKLTSTAIVNIDKNDLLAITVSRAEIHIKTESAKATKAIKESEAHITKTRDALALSVKQHGTSTTSTNLVELAKALKLLGSTQEPKTEVDYNLDKELIIITTNLGRDSYNNNQTLARLTIPFTDEMVKAKQDIKEAETQLSTLRDVAIEWRKKLADIPTLERQARARLAEATLRSSEEGQALLDSIEAQYKVDFLALPSV